MKHIGIVQTKYGAVSGVKLDGKYEGITMFKGVPFAAPPVGELRWKPPIDPKPWKGIRSCDSYGPVCIQPTNGDLDAEPWATDFYYMGTPPMSEDCLYLNVTTGAAEPGEKRPVFMWFHGGGPDHGYSYEAEFDPRELARKGVVVVSVAQRLSMFGYLSLPQLDAEQGGKSGNYIVMDNMKALEWVIENIEGFGGDSDCITVGGQSAGTGKSSSLAFTPLAHGHVKRVVNQSGLVWNRKNKTLAEAEADCAAYLTAIGIDPTMSLDELRKLEPYGFLPNGKKIRIPGKLIADGEIVPHLNIADSVDAFGMELDYLTGTNLGETHMKPGVKRGQAGFTTAKEFYEAAKEMLGELYDQFDFENLIKVTDENVDRESRRLASYGLSISDRMGGLVMNRRFGEYRAEKTRRKIHLHICSPVCPPLARRMPEQAGIRIL